MSRILIVDDDIISSKLICKKFQKEGFEVLHAMNGRECLDTIDKQKVDIVLLDIMMPDMKGDEVLLRIREKLTAFELPVIMVTGLSETRDIVNCLRNGANDYIVKPVNFDVAKARVNTQLQLSYMHEQNIKHAELETAHAMIVTYNHEINNPLTIALGLLRKFKKENDMSVLERVEGSLYRISDIVKKIDAISSNSTVEQDEYTQQEKMIKLK